MVCIIRIRLWEIYDLWIYTGNTVFFILRLSSGFHSYYVIIMETVCLNIMRSRENGRQFPADNFKFIFVNENIYIWINISLKFVPKGPINNIPALVQMMAWRRPGNKPLSEHMMVNLLTHICITGPQWNASYYIRINLLLNISNLKCIFWSWKPQAFLAAPIMAQYWHGKCDDCMWGIS